MKINMWLLELSYLYSIVQLVPRKQTEIAKILFETMDKYKTELVKIRKDLIKEYCEQKEVDIEQEDKSMKKEMRWVPKEATQEEYMEKMGNVKVDIEFSPLVYPALKNVVMDFPNIYIDANTGQRGLKGQEEIFLYEQVKELFK